MFILSCGRGSDGDGDVARDELREASAAEDPRTSSHSQIDLSAREVPLLRRREVTLSNYDSMSTKLKTASRTNFPSLWPTASTTISSCPLDPRTTTPASDTDELPVPDLHVGQYSVFCQPHTWSPVFASPGEFTLRVDSVRESNGDVVVRMAVVCSSVQAIKDDTAATPTAGTPKRKSFVQYVERSHNELVTFCETMSLKYLGHHLMEQLPHLPPSVFSTSQKALDQHGEAVLRFLTRLMTISDVGFNRLVSLQEPVANDLIVRDFFNLPLGFGGPALLSTSSCDARLERGRAHEPLSLPSAWLDVDTTQSTSCSALRSGETQSPRLSAPLRSLPSRHDLKPSHSRMWSPRSVPRFTENVGRAPPMDSKPSNCTCFVKPSRWHAATAIEGAFTTEIAGITIADGRAAYTICVLYYARGKQEMITIDRRFSEFDALVHRVERKLRALSVRNYFPTKTLFRYLSASYLERRAAYLQRFLEKLLQTRFLGVLEQPLSMAAEPNVRAFLQLPSVEWSVTPWPQTIASHTHGNSTSYQADSIKYDRRGSIESPSGAAGSIYSETSYSSGTMFGVHDANSSTPRYQSFSYRRTGSV